MHALILLQSNRLTVFISREYSELLFDQLITNRSVTCGTVKILLFKHARPTCSYSPAAMILIQCRFCWLQ